MLVRFFLSGIWAQRPLSRTYGPFVSTSLDAALLHLMYFFFSVSPAFFMQFGQTIVCHYVSSVPQALKTCSYLSTTVFPPEAPVDGRDFETTPRIAEAT
jgi:hypothetical protein